MSIIEKFIFLTFDKEEMGEVTGSGVAVGPTFKIDGAGTARPVIVYFSTYPPKRSNIYYRCNLPI